MVLRALTLAHDPTQVPTQLRGKLVGDVLGPTHPLSGVEPGLDVRGEPHLVLSVEQRDLADLREIDPHRVDRDGELGVLAGLAQRLGLLIPNAIPDGSTWSTGSAAPPMASGTLSCERSNDTGLDLLRSNSPSLTGHATCCRLITGAGWGCRCPAPGW
jgi:hypothetical protein